MKFLVDAQLPVGLVNGMRQLGHDAVHTSELPMGNRTTDADVLRICLDEGRVLVTKDADFVDSYLLRRQPRKLLVVATGNIPNPELRSLFLGNIVRIVKLLEDSSYLEFSRQDILVHE